MSRPGPRHGQPGAQHSACDTAVRPATRPAGGHDTALGAATIRHARAFLGEPVRAGWAKLGALCT